MRLKPLLLIISFPAISASLFAKPVVDSVGVENQNGKKVILHKLDPKDNYYAIGRRYNVKPQLIIQFNNNAVLHVGDIIKVPTELPFAQQPAATQASANTAEAGSIVQYKVAQHEYLYGIAKRFNTTIEDIKKLNNLQTNNLSPGQILNIRQGAGAQTSAPVQTQMAPAPMAIPVHDNPPVQSTSVNTPANAQTQPPANTGQPGAIIQYTVTKHEYLYSVAKRFNTTVEDIKALNNLKSNSLNAGQVLNIRQGSSTAAVQAQAPVQYSAVPKSDTIPPAKRDTTSLNTTADSLGSEHKASRYGLFEKNEKGIATWMDDASFDPNKKLILHRTAPIGTVIKITNPMTNRTTYAKVVGRFADNESTKDVILVMTKNVAESLGALDKRFHVNISYGVANE